MLGASVVSGVCLRQGEDQCVSGGSVLEENVAVVGDIEVVHVLQNFEGVRPCSGAVVKQVVE